MKWLGFIVILLVLLTPIPVMAIGVSPYTVNANVPNGSYAELTFTVLGCNSVDLSLENIPLVVEPSHTSVVGNKITVKILGNLSVALGVYNGHLVILESGKQVGTGVKVNLAVNHISGSNIWYGGGSHFSLVDTAQPDITIPDEVIPPTIVPPPPIEPETIEPSIYEPVEGIPMPTQRSTVNWGTILLVGCAVLVIGLSGWYLWNNQKKKKKEQSQN